MFHNSVLDDRRQNRVTCWVSNDEGTAAGAECSAGCWELGILKYTTIFLYSYIHKYIAFIKIR